jgi:hypothetical protein
VPGLLRIGRRDGARPDAQAQLLQIIVQRGLRLHEADTHSLRRLYETRFLVDVPTVTPATLLKCAAAQAASVKTVTQAAKATRPATSVALTLT